MKRFTLVAWVLLAVVLAAASASAMPLGLRTAMWGIAAAQRGGDEPPEPPEPPYGTPIFTIVDGVLTEVDLNGATEVVIPESVTNVADKVFYQCDELRSVTIPACVTYIGLDAFARCTSLREVIFEEGGTELTLVYPFSDTALTDLNLPARWTSRSNGNPFEFCAALTNVTITPGNSTFAIVNGLLLSADGKAVYGALGGVSEIEIPESVETIAYRSLYGLPHVEEIVLPASVSALSGQCISQCASLKSITIEGSVEMTLRSGNPLFADCPNMKSVYFSGNAPTGDGIQYVYQSAPSDLVTYVTRGSTGWGVDIPGMWNGRRIEYSDPAPPEPEPPDPSTIRIDTEASYETGADGSFELDLGELIVSASTPKVTVKGLPAGIKFTAGKLVISGKATRPGVYKVTVSATNATVKQPATATFDLVVSNLASEVLPGLEQEADAYGVVTCGVAFDPALVDCSVEKGWTVKVAGLPAGLKYDAKSGEITGVPTKVGTFTVTFTASKKGEKSQVATITLKTEALPMWATGTFAGAVSFCRLQPPYAPYDVADGFATMTVAANGKVSGKATVCGTNWTFSAASCSSAERLCGEAVAIEIATAMKSGKVEVPVVFQIEPSESPEGDGAALANAESTVYAALDESGSAYIDGILYRNLLRDKATSAEAKAEAARIEGVYTASLGEAGGGGCGGYLSLTVGKDGAVKASGKLGDGTALSASSQLFYDAEAFGGYGVVLFASPSAYKGGCFVLPVSFGTERGQIVSPWDGFWENRNPQATGEYGEWFCQRPEAVGAYYDKAEKLNAYYKSLRFETEAPQLSYTHKWTYLDGSGRKTTDAETLDADAVDTLWQAGVVATINANGAFDVAKATKPVQDRQTKEWSYNGANDGALTLSFAQATGIFKGSYTFWYDYMSAFDETKPEGKQETWSHTSKKVSFEGIWVQGADSLRGFYLWDATATYADPKTGKPKTYKYKQSYGVSLAP